MEPANLSQRTEPANLSQGGDCANGRRKIKSERTTRVSMPSVSEMMELAQIGMLCNRPNITCSRALMYGHLMYISRRYNQVPAGDSNPQQEKQPGSSQPSNQVPAGNSNRPENPPENTRPSQPANCPRGMDSFVFETHMSLPYLMFPNKIEGVSSDSIMDAQMLSAARSGDVEKLKAWAQNKVEVRSQMTQGRETVLHIAAANGHLKFIEELLKLPGVNPSQSMPQVEENGEGGGSAAGANASFVALRNREGNTALHVAAIHGNAEIVKTLVRENEELAEKTNNAGETALMKAAEEGYAEIVQNLLKLKKPGEMKRPLDDQTPLHLAVLNTKKDVVDKLIEHRPGFLREKNMNGMTPLHVAAFIPIPISTPPIFSATRRRIHRDKHEISKKLIETDSSVCYMGDNNNQTPLHLAVIQGNAGLVRHILHHCEDCSDMVDSVGRNPLHLAVENATEIFNAVGTEFRDIMMTLLKKTFINCIDYFGRTPLDIATQYESTDPQLFRHLRTFLYKHGGRQSAHWLPDMPMKQKLSEISLWNSQAISVTAVLVATVAFTVAFTLPGKHDSAEVNSPIFQVLVIFDALAFCFSIASVLLVVYALFIAKEADPILCDMSVGALWLGLVSTAITFGAAIHMVVAPKCLWLAMVVWIIVCYLPIWIAQLFSRGKAFLFRNPTVITRHIIGRVVQPLLILCDPILKLKRVICHTSRCFLAKQMQSKDRMQ